MTHFWNGRTWRRSFVLAFALLLGLSLSGRIAMARILDEPTLSAPAKQPATENQPNAEQQAEEAEQGEQAEPGMEGKPDSAERKQAHMHKSGMHLISDAATILGMEPEALKKELKAGKSIAEVAKAKGMAEADLTNKMIEAKFKKIDEAVKAGKWSSEKADKVKERLPQHMSEMINHKGFHNKRDTEKK